MKFSVDKIQPVEELMEEINGTRRAVSLSFSVIPFSAGNFLPTFKSVP